MKKLGGGAPRHMKAEQSRAGGRRPPASGGGQPSAAGSLLRLALLFVASVLVGVYVLPRLVTRSGPMVGKLSPPVTVIVAHNGDEGARMNLASLRGKPVVLDFWATWCGPCAVQAPIFDRVARRYRDKGVTFIGVNVGEDAEIASAYAKRKNLSYLIAVDGDGLDASSAFGVTTLPTVVVIDKDGKVVEQLSRVVYEDELAGMIDRAL